MDRHAAQIAVALSWDQSDQPPKVTAKGQGVVAQEIINCAREHGVLLEDDPALVEVLSQVEIGDTVPEVLYIAVAEIIAFAYLLRGEILPRRSTDPARR